MSSSANTARAAGIYSFALRSDPMLAIAILEQTWRPPSRRAFGIQIVSHAFVLMRRSIRSLKPEDSAAAELMDQAIRDGLNLNMMLGPPMSDVIRILRVTI
jgi:hypothetical protein